MFNAQSSSHRLFELLKPQTYLKLLPPPHLFSTVLEFFGLLRNKLFSRFMKTYTLRIIVFFSALFFSFRLLEFDYFFLVRTDMRMRFSQPDYYLFSHTTSLVWLAMPTNTHSLYQTEKCNSALNPNFVITSLPLRAVYGCNRFS